MSARGDVLISARGLGYGYPGKAVGRGVDLDVRIGEVVCLLGPNGSGKTTLFKTLLGLIPAQAGTVCFLGCACDMLFSQSFAKLQLEA